METKLDNIYSALAKAQGEIKAAKKSSENPFFKSHYADISECIDAIQGPASKNGLAMYFNFKTEIVGDNPVSWIQYKLSHSSGETIISDWLVLFMKDKTPQGFGACSTYYRRQLLKAVFQLGEQEDDGNSQSQPPPQRAPVKNYAPGAQPR